MQLDVQIFQWGEPFGLGEVQFWQGKGHFGWGGAIFCWLPGCLGGINCA